MPEFPTAIIVLMAGYEEVTAEMPIGLIVFQEKFMLQLLAPKAIRQDEEAGVRVPDMGLTPVVILKVNWVVLLSGLPVTVIVWSPTGALGEIARVIIDVQIGEQSWLEMLSTDTPDGKPETERVTGRVVPARMVLVIVFWTKTLFSARATRAAAVSERKGNIDANEKVL